ncbi:MAG: ABC transporter permease [Candidatus Micrarchaeota archaeon]|nr:ABC transporter permease [Candidatus Micrarchaeota archaeon]
MDYLESLRYILMSISHRKLRTFLTILAIVIGIVAILSMISLGRGIKEDINAQLQRFSPRNIFIVPGNIQIGNNRGINALTGKLYERDADVLARMPEIEKVSKLIGASATISFKGKEIKAMVSGVEIGVFLEVSPAFELEKGRYLRENEQNAVVLGYKIAKDTFDKPIEVGNTIFINGRPYVVVGIFKEQNTQVGGNPNNFILLDYNEVKQKFVTGKQKDEVMFLNVLVREGYDIEEVAARIEEMLRISHKLPKDTKDFTVFSPKVIQDQVNNIINLLNTFLGAIASISLIVGAIGISNTMFSAVLERTREIGILKAVGARESDIYLLFLLEGGIISLIGGVIAIIIAMLLSYVFDAFDVAYSIGLDLVIISLIFSFFTGVIASIIPARNAAKMSAVEALRYE